MTPTPTKTPSQEVRDRADRLRAASEEALRTRNKHVETRNDVLKDINRNSWPEMHDALATLADEEKAIATRFYNLSVDFSHSARGLYEQAVQLEAEEDVKEGNPHYCVMAEIMRDTARQAEKDAEETAQARDKHLETAKAAKLDMADPSQDHAVAYSRWREATKDAVSLDRMRESQLFAAATTYLKASVVEAQTIASATAAAAAAADKTTA